MKKQFNTHEQSADTLALEWRKLGSYCTFCFVAGVNVVAVAVAVRFGMCTFQRSTLVSFARFGLLRSNLVARYSGRQEMREETKRWEGEGMCMCERNPKRI